MKPRGYRGWRELGNDEGSNTKTSSTDVVQRQKLKLSIEVLAAQELPRLRHPYVLCELHVESPQEHAGTASDKGARSDEGEIKQHTKTRNYVDADFAGEKLEFTDLCGAVPQLSFIR